MKIHNKTQVAIDKRGIDLTKHKKIKISVVDTVFTSGDIFSVEDLYSDLMYEVSESSHDQYAKSYGIITCTRIREETDQEFASRILKENK